MTQIYCGNNSQDSDLLSGNVILGTRFGCMRKGIGRGLNLPYDPKFKVNYIPIDKCKIYCGKLPILPENYDSLGSLPQCLQKGIGIGKRKRAQNPPPPPSSFSPKILLKTTKNIQIIIFVLIFLILSVGLFTYLYVKKPSIVIDKYNEENKKYINWYKFNFVFITSIIILIVILFMIFKNIK